MGLFGKFFADDEPEAPSTIGDKDYRRLQDRARKANPDLDRLDNPRGIERRKAAAEQHDRRWLS
jgi:hypothetical protein